MWGKYWFMIENPTYGDWEGALYKFNFDRSNQEIIQIRNKKLDEADEKSLVIAALIAILQFIFSIQ